MVAFGVEMHIRCTYGAPRQNFGYKALRRAVDMAAPAIKITEAVRARALKRVDGKSQPSVTRDADIKGFALIVTTRRAFWCLFFQPMGVNPATGRRWGGRRAPRARRRLHNAHRRCTRSRTQGKSSRPARPGPSSPGHGF